tara:strand:+ start:1010 stop:1699 length:690 start_codon:yes stop_codon:yes gene_type:complete
MNDLISVIMSTYNSEKTIETAIESILNQSYSNFELLITDDFSSDSTVDKIKKYVNSKNNIYLFENKYNVGLTKNLNFLIKKSKGKYIARQDADDQSLVNRLEVQLKMMNKYNLDFCSTRAIIKNSNNLIPNLSFYLPNELVMKFKNPFIHGTLLISKKIMVDIGYYDENFYYSQDFKLMKDLISKKYKYKFLKKPYYVLNTENNISTLNKEQQKYYADCVRNNITPKKI